MKLPLSVTKEIGPMGEVGVVDADGEDVFRDIGTYEAERSAADPGPAAMIVRAVNEYAELRAIVEMLAGCRDARMIDMLELIARAKKVIDR